MRLSTVILTISCAHSAESVGLIDPRDQLDDIGSYVEARKPHLATAGRKLDVFGLAQDPVKEKIERRQAEAAPKAAQKSVLPLQTILEALPLTMIDPLGQQVLLEGSGAVKAGQTIELDYEKETIQLRLEAVRTKGAYFRELKTKQIGLRSMQKLANGIQPANGRRTSPLKVEGISSVDQPIKVNLAPSGLTRSK